MKMIEEWMLLANREVAKFISDKIKKEEELVFLEFTICQIWKN